MPSVKEKESMGSYKKFLLNKMKNERDIEIVINGNKEGISTTILSKITGLSLKEIEAILSKEENAKS